MIFLSFIKKIQYTLCFGLIKVTRKNASTMTSTEPRPNYSCPTFVRLLFGMFKNFHQTRFEARELSLGFKTDRMIDTL